MKKHLVLLGISLMIITAALIGAISIRTGLPPFSAGSLPQITLVSFTGIWDFHHPNSSLIGFEVSVTNPNDTPIEVQFPLCTILDDQGMVVVSYRPHFSVANLTDFQVNNQTILLPAHQTITLHSSEGIIKSSVSDYCWEYLSSLNTVSIAGIMQINGHLHWFASNPCEIILPICK